MKIVVIGLGSMGKRRIRLLHEIEQRNKIDFEFYATDDRLDRREEIKKLACELGININVQEKLSDIIAQNYPVDVAFVSTSPLSHAKIIKECLEHNLNVFSEINLVDDGYDDNIRLANNKQLTLFLSSTLVYRDEIRYIKTFVEKSSKPLNYNYHVGQYLSDWHPWENYRDIFIGNMRTNGCREVLAIELPWIVNAFGEIESVMVMSDRKTNLDIEFNDCYNILIKHVTGHTGVFTVDVISKIPVRDLRIIGENIYISWDGSPLGLKAYNSDKQELESVDLYFHVEHIEGYNPTIIENMYLTEILDFLSVLNGEKTAEYSFEQDKVILDWIDQIEGL